MSGRRSTNTRDTDTESQATSIPVADDGFTEYAGSLPRKRMRKSKVWKEFTPGEGYAVCIHCKSKLVSGGKSGTSHLKRHLERCSKRPVGLPIGFGVGDDDEDFVFYMSDLRKFVVLFIAQGGHAFSVVEEMGFNNMMFTATNKYVPFSRTTATRELFGMYVVDRSKVQNMLTQAAGRISFTTDNWKSDHTWQHYICVTAHFVDSNWKLHKRILRFRAIDPPYDGASIAAEIFMFLCQWKLDRRVLSITVDNATYNDSMISHLHTRLRQRGLVGDGRFLHIRCCAHIVNLIVKAGMDCIKPILENIRALLRIIGKSANRSKEFFEMAKKCHLDTRRKLGVDMEVRWNSTYKMLDNVFYYKEVFMTFGADSLAFKSLVPSEAEWYKLGVIHRFLKVFYDVTCMYSSVKQPTSNLYFKGAYMIHARLLEAKASDDDFLVAIVTPMMGKFDKYWSEYNLPLSCASILDPRLKVKFVEYCFTKLYGAQEAGLRVKHMVETLRSLFDQYKKSAAPKVVGPPSPNLIADGLFSDYGDFTGRSPTCRTRRSQLELYLEDHPLGIEMDLDVLEYWKQNSIRFPDLAALARDLLTIPVSTVASESAFSLSGRTISPSRSSLKSKTIQALMCVQDWRRAEGEILSDSDFTVTESEIEDEFVVVVDDDDATAVDDDDDDF